MSEMVERVARALALSDTNWADRRPEPGVMVRNAAAGPMWPDYVVMARAAIKAMREPTEAMCAAGMDEPEGGIAPMYRAMIDAALGTTA